MYSIIITGCGAVVTFRRKRGKYEGISQGERHHEVVSKAETKYYLDVAQFGSVHEWGSWGRRFKSSHPDHRQVLSSK